MSTPVKCPNPACPFLFDPSRVPPGAVIACPTCGLRFTLGPAALPPPQHYVPPVVDPPVTEPRSSRRRPDADDPKPKRSPAAVGFILAISGVVLVSLALVIVLVIATQGRNIGGNRSTDEIRFGNLPVSYKPTGESAWTRDTPAEAAFGVPLGYARKEQSGWFLVDALPFDYDVRPADLRERVRKKLGAQFKELPSDLNETKAKLAGKDALKFEFRGEYRPTGDTCLGEVYAIGVKVADGSGAGVWAYQWAPERQYSDLAAEWERLRAAVIATDAAVTAPVRAFSKGYRSKSGLFSVTDHEGLWQEEKPAGKLDKAAELWLEGTPKHAPGRDLAPTATLLVCVLAPEGDAKAQAVAHAVKEIAADEADREELTADPTGEPPPVTDVPDNSPPARYKLRFKGADPSVNKLLVVATTDAGDKRVVAYAYCQLKAADYWERRLTQAVGSLKVK